MAWIPSDMATEHENSDCSWTYRSTSKDGVEYPPNAVPLSQLPKPFQDYLKTSWLMVSGT